MHEFAADRPCNDLTSSRPATRSQASSRSRSSRERKTQRNSATRAAATTRTTSSSRPQARRPRAPQKSAEPLEAPPQRRAPLPGRPTSPLLWHGTLLMAPRVCSVRLPTKGVPILFVEPHLRQHEKPHKTACCGGRRHQPQAQCHPDGGETVVELIRPDACCCGRQAHEHDD
jgi:hypothetical protein